MISLVDLQPTCFGHSDISHAFSVAVVYVVSSYCHCGSNSIISYVPETPIIDVINHVGNWRQIAFLEVKLEEEFPFSNVESHDDYLVVLLVSVNVIDKKFEFLMCAN